MATAGTRIETVHDALVNELLGLGTEVIFGLLGEDTVGLITEAGQAGIKYCGARHENIAIGMADGYAWRSGGLGVCTVTRGPGLVNGAMAIRTAARAGRRVLIITGDMATDGDWEWDFKSIEHAPLLASMGVEYFAAGSAEEVVPTFRRAAAAAAHGTVVYSVPADVLHAKFASGDLQDEPVALPAPPEAVEPVDDEIAAAVELLAAGKRPLILAGRGVDPGLRSTLEELAERTGGLLGTTLLARELFQGSPYNLGVVGGFAAEGAVPVLAEIDCVVAFGASLNPWTAGHSALFDGVPVIHVDSDPAKLGLFTPVRLGICADAGATARKLLAAVPDRHAADKPFHSAETLEALRRPLWSGPDESTSDELDPRAVTTTLDALLPEERTIVMDSGRHMTSTGRFMRFLSPQAFRHTADGGAIGMGLGVALGAQAASPDRPTVLFVGDGGLSMTLGDLETAVRNQLPLIVIVLNDHAYGSELVHLMAGGLPLDNAILPEVDFAAVARALGLEAATVRTLEELRAHATELEGRTTPLLLDCKIRQDLFISRVRW